MADWGDGDWAGAAEKQASNPAAPSGLQQQAGAAAYAWQDHQRAAANTWGQRWDQEAPSWREEAKSWFGGRNMAGTENGWDTDWLRRANEQREEYETRAREAGKGSEFFRWFADEKATGLALWDDPEGRWQRGDVFDNGENTGNIYDIYDQETANLMAAMYMFDDAEQVQLFKAGPEAAHEAIWSRMDEYSDQAKYGPGQEAFAEDKQDYLDHFGSGDWLGGTDTSDEWVSGLAGAAGAAAIAAPLLAGGPVGWIAYAGIVGAGAFTSWANRDQYAEVYARTRATADRARSYGEGGNQVAYWSTALQGIGEGAMQAISPLQNVVQAWTDSKYGDWGDGRNEFFELNEDGERIRGGFAETMNVLAMFGDSFLQFGSAAAQASYMASMGLVAGGGVAELASTRAVFNPMLGEFDELNGAGEDRKSVV